MQIIPDNDRFPNLKARVVAYAEGTHAIRVKYSKVAAKIPSLFFKLLSPWLEVTTPDGPPATDAETGKQHARTLGFDGDRISSEVSEIFSNDAHLRECCGSTLALAYVLDDFFVRPAVELIAEKAGDQIEDLYRNFTAAVYEQGSFTRMSYSHLFNFDSPLSTLDLGALAIKKLDSAEIIAVLGERTPLSHSWLQPPNVGSFFVVQEETGVTDDLFASLQQRHWAAVNLLRVVQYHKPGVVHIDYSVPHFRPPWVNNLRKFGLFFVGNPRRIPYRGGTRFFTLTEEELPSIRRKLAAYTSSAITTLIADQSCLFRQSSLRAGDYYEASLTYEQPVERLLALSVALEALFSPGDSHEYSFRISQTASQLLGKSAPERKRIYQELRSLYDKRSQLMHGTYKVKEVYDGTFVTHDEIDSWSDHIRDALLRFLILYFRGKRTRGDLNTVREDLLLSALDSGVAEELRRLSDLEVFLGELERGEIT